jgi:hypothetical protein
LATACSATNTPELEVRNYGNNTVSSARIQLSVNGSLVETKDFTLSLDDLESAIVSFTPITVSTGNNSIDFTILLTNGVADGKSANNAISQSFFVSESIATPFSQDFSTPPSGWVIQNPDQLITWQLANAPKETGSNTALMLNFNQYEESYGEFDIVLSPVFDLSSAGAALLSFDVSHAQYSGSNDQLRVVVLKNCEPLSSGTTVYNKVGATLKTTTSTNEFFVPDGAGDWRKESLNLSSFLGEGQVQLAFIGINDWGNNLYLDNITLVTSEFEDLALVSMVSPSLVTCSSEISPRIRVQNAGTIAIENFKVEYVVNNLPLQVAEFNYSPADAETIEVELPEITLNEGTNLITITITEPNGVADQTPDNNSQTFTVIVNSESDRIPLREDFENTFTPAWTLVGASWDTTATNYGNSLYFNSYPNSNVGEEGWLVSPVLDFSSTTTASMTFDASVGSRAGRKENLLILVSSDCGNTYESDSIIVLSAHALNTPWSPEEESEWEQKVTIDLSDFAGEETVRVAFVVTNQNGNNLFLDNIEFFTTDIPNLEEEVTETYSIYGYNLEDPSQNALKVTFNLAERQDVHYSVVDMLGKVHAEGILKDVLNQTYPLALEQNLRGGMYIVRMKIQGKYVADRIVVAD